MTEEEIAVKFTALGGDVIGKDQCKKLQSYIMSIETAEDLGGLFELTTALSGSSSPLLDANLRGCAAILTIARRSGRHYAVALPASSLPNWIP